MFRAAPECRKPGCRGRNSHPGQSQYWRRDRDRKIVRQHRSRTINASGPFTYSLQGCRKSTLGSDDCGAWSDYRVHAARASAKRPSPSPSCRSKSADVTPRPGARRHRWWFRRRHARQGRRLTPFRPTQQCQGPTECRLDEHHSGGLNANVAVSTIRPCPPNAPTHRGETSGLVGPATVTGALVFRAKAPGTSPTCCSPSTACQLPRDSEVHGHV
jgi:hypothetical protein